MRGAGGDPAVVERISPGDRTQLATDVGPVAMNVAAVLVGDPQGAPFDIDTARLALADRVMGIPRLRQRLAAVPPGLGAPIWVDDERFDPAAHIALARFPEPGDRQALLDLAIAEVVQPLPRDRPLWRALFVTGGAGGQVGLVLVLHHVLADGIGGLAVLAALADPGMPGAAPAARPAPTRAALVADRATAAVRAFRRVPTAVRRVGRARAELGRRGAILAPRCSLNAPTGGRRHVSAVELDLAVVRAAARRHDATVNDVLLVAAAAALERLLAERGERVPALVVSVPISARPDATIQRLGNEVGVMPVTVPLAGPLRARLTRVAAATAAQRDTVNAGRGASAALIGPAFRTFAAVGAFRWMVDRQRLVNTFLTNLRGPTEHLRIHGLPITSITPITITAGNVTTAFAALSYAGTLTVAIVTDPDRVPEHDLLAATLADAVHDLADQAWAPVRLGYEDP